MARVGHQRGGRSPWGAARHWKLLGCLLAALAPPLPSPAHPPAPSEYEVKAAMLYSFAKFVEWPGGTPPPGPFLVVVHGEDPFGPLLETTLKEKSVAGRPFLVHRSPGSRPPEPGQLVFVARSEARRVKEVLAEVRQPGALTVSDIEGFAAAGGIIGFVLDGNRVRFEINPGAARAAGLNISSRLLQLATIIGAGGRRSD